MQHYMLDDDIAKYCFNVFINVFFHVCKIKTVHKCVFFLISIIVNLYSDRCTKFLKLSYDFWKISPRSYFVTVFRTEILAMCDFLLHNNHTVIRPKWKRKGYHGKWVRDEVGSWLCSLEVLTIMRYINLLTYLLTYLKGLGDAKCCFSAGCTTTFIISRTFARWRHSLALVPLLGTSVVRYLKLNRR